MKPHPRIRKTIKWGGAAVTVLLVVVWIGSAWWGVGGPIGFNGAWGLSTGKLMLIRFAPPERMDRQFGWGPNGNYPFKWWFDRISNSVFQMQQIPLWVFPACTLWPTAIAWRLDSLVRRRERVRLNLCSKCGYDRTGLAIGAKCPECGAAPANV